MTVLGRLWTGELPLVTAFWNWALLGGLLVNATTSLLFVLLINAGWPVAALIVGYACSVPYNVVVTVGVWRAAGRHEGDPKWAMIARVVTIGGMILLSMT